MDLSEDRTWTVVHFLKENSVEAVPTNWIIGNRCYWPSFTSEKVHKAIRNHEHPNTCWESFENRIFRNATYDTYKEASSKSKLAEDTSDFNDCDESRETRKSRSRKKLSSSSDDNDSCSLDVPSPPRNNNKSVKAPARNINSSSSNVRNNGNSFALKDYHQDDINLSINPSCTCCPLHRNEFNISLKNLITDIRDITKKQNLSMSVATETMDQIKKLSDELKKIRVEDILPDSSLHTKFKFPISDVDTFDKLEEYLSDVQQFGSAVIEVSKFGGTDLYDFVKRSLSWFMKNSLLMQYTWHGTKEKKGLISTKLGQLIIKAAEKTTFYTDKKSVEDSIKKYVRRAKERSAYELRAEPANN